MTLHLRIWRHLVVSHCRQDLNAWPPLRGFAGFASKGKGSLPLAGLIIGMLASCAPVTWDRPQTTQTEFNMDKAMCQLTAKGVTPDIGPSRPYYTLAGSTGAGIADGVMLGIERRENFQLCMASRGYTARAAQ